jgi:hypothetical protein
MKKILALQLALIYSLCFVATTNIAHAEAETKKVCHDKVDKAGKVVNGKDGKPVQECKTIKVHKKLEGTEIPPKK